MAERLSSWVTILMAGKTRVPNLFIKDIWLEEIVEDYDPSVYEASINEDHFRIGRCYGRVSEVKLSRHPKLDKLTLQARLVPNSFFLEMNSSKQKLYTSCEVDVNFAGSGKAYLTGLAITNCPVSLGTDRIELSQKKISIFLSESLVLAHQIPFTEKTFLNHHLPFSVHSDVEAEYYSESPQRQSTVKSNVQEPEMNKEELKLAVSEAIKENLSTEIKTLGKTLESFTTNLSMAENRKTEDELKKGKLKEKVQSPEQSSNKEFSSEASDNLDSAIRDLSTIVSKMQLSLDSLTQEVPGTTTTENTGTVDEDVF